MIDFNFSQTQNIFSQENDSSKCCSGRHGHDDSTAQAIKRIASLSKAEDIKECISNITALMEYLNHENDTVKKFAVGAMVQLVQKAAELLKKESDPEKIAEYSKFLLKAIDAIEGSSVQLDSDTKAELGQIKSFLNGVLKNTGKEEGSLNNTDTFTGSLEQSRKALVGDNYSDEFIRSDLMQLRDMTIFGNNNKQFQTSQNPDGSLSKFIFA